MRNCGHDGESDDCKLLCVKCNAVNFEIVDKLESGEIVARCGGCGQETDLSVIVSARYGGAIELVAALRNLYAVSTYKANNNKDEVGKDRYSKKRDQLEKIIDAPMYHNPLDVAADLFKIIENTAK